MYVENENENKNGIFQKCPNKVYGVANNQVVDATINNSDKKKSLWSIHDRISANNDVLIFFLRIFNVFDARVRVRLWKLNGGETFRRY